MYSGRTRELCATASTARIAAEHPATPHKARTSPAPASIAAPIKAGQPIGTANVTEGGKPVATIALLAPADVAKKRSMVKRLFGLF